MPILETPQLQHCGKCGTVLSFYAPQGLCAACLLESAFVEMTGREEPTKPAPLLAFDDYELLEEIARGGMGVVYRARQISLNRVVAVKMILAGQLANAAEVQRFKAESESAAHLRHPNIVAIYEAGAHNGQPFFSMDYVEGRNLAELTHNGPLPARLAARYLKTIAEAVQYAHSRGVLHRDLKPSNILIDAVDQPRITDFGLAKRFDISGPQSEIGNRKSEITITGQVLGSPNFMPPEQAAGTRGEVGPASDLYSLGAILYHLITGRPPFLADSMAATLRLVAETEPTPPRLLVPAIPRDLETICLKCLEKEPQRRYASAKELAEDIGRFLRDEPIQARSASRVEKFTRRCRRHPAVAGLTAVAGLLLIAVAVVSSVSAFRLHKAEQAGQKKLWDSYLAQARANRWSGLVGRRFQSLEALRNAAEIRPSIELRNQAIACMALVDLRPVKEWETRDWAPFVFDATYERYATTNNRGDVVVRRVNDDRELMNVPETRVPVHELGFSPDGQFLAARYKPGDSRTRVFDLPAKTMVAEFTNGAFCFTPDSRSLAVGQHRLNTRPSVIIHDLRTRREVASLETDFAPEVMKFNPTGDRLALVERLGSKVQIRDARTGTLVRSLDHAKAVSSFDWHPSGDYLAASSYDQLVHVWDFTQRERRDMNLAHGDVSILAFYSHQGGLLTSVGWNNVLRFWNATSGRELLSIPALGYRGAPFSADDRWIAYWMGRQKIRLCELAAGRECRAVSFGDSLHGAVFCDVSPDGQLPALVLRLHLKLWDETATRDLARVPEDGVVGARYDVAGNNLITAGTHGLKRWPMEWRRETAGRSLRIGPPEEFGPRGAIQAVWLVDNRKRLLALKTPALHVLDAATRRELSQVRLDAEISNSLASPDGKWFAAELPNSGTVRVWEIESGRAVVDLPVAAAVGLAFTPDGHLLLVGSEVEYTAWRCDSWKRAYAIPRPDTGGARSRVTFNPDGSVGAVTEGPESIRLFDPATGREFATLEPPEPSVIVALKFSLDGAHLMATTDRSGIHIWDLRLIRQQLAAMKLDWDSPPLPPRYTNASGGRLHITFLKVPVPPRDPRCTPAQIDLAAHYNCTFTNFAVMTGMAGNDLAPLATGLQRLDNTDFDVRGAVQLLGHMKYTGSPAPAEVTGIVVDQSCRALNFLHSCLYADANGVPAGATVGEYIVHYTDGRSDTIPLKNGDNIADWWDYPPKPRKMSPGTGIAWRGANVASQSVANNIVLYKFRWENPHSDTIIATIDFKSALIDTAPFLIALTAE